MICASFTKFKGYTRLLSERVLIFFLLEWSSNEFDVELIDCLADRLLLLSVTASIWAALLLKLRGAGTKIDFLCSVSELIERRAGIFCAALDLSVVEWAEVRESVRGLIPKCANTFDTDRPDSAASKGNSS